MAPDIELPETLVAATFAGDIYSAATPPRQIGPPRANVPGNAFPAVWAASSTRGRKTVMATATKGIRVTATKSILTRIEGTKTVNGVSFWSHSTRL
jgi:hypothetical protein